MTIGVAIALYNGERFLLPQLDSIRLQTRPADRVVLCDDGSKDNTMALVGEYIEKHSLSDKWTLIKNGENLGYARNFYKAIELCGTDIVFLSDQDDLWDSEKLRKMTSVMEEREDINLLCCMHGVIDAEGEEMHSILEKKGKSTEELRPIDVHRLMRSYNWPGMAMCLRYSFFSELLLYIKDSRHAHDMIFALSAADKKSFFEYDYVGVYHRRHDSNVANEESRITKLLDLERKKRDMQVYNKLLDGLLALSLPISEESSETVSYRLDLSRRREEAITERKFASLVSLYRGDNRKLLRTASLLCDIWLICFGKYK